MRVEPGNSSDYGWVERIFKQAKVLGNFYWMKQAIERGHGFNVIREVGFVRFNKNRDGQYVIQEIAVDLDQQRNGIGSLLLDSVPRPTILKTDSDNLKSNPFYKKHGFVLTGKSHSKDMKKTFHWWLRV